MTNRIVLRFQHCLAAGAAFLLLGLAVSAQTPAAAVPTTPPAVWTTYTYAAEGFSASFPSEPSLTKQNVPTNAGSFELRSYIVDLGSTALFVGVCDYGSAIAGHDPQASLKGAENGALENSKSHLISDQKITLGIYPGLEFDSESDSAHFSARIYLVGTTLYQVLTVAPLTDKYADSSRFLDSFTIIPRTTN